MVLFFAHSINITVNEDVVRTSGKFLVLDQILRKMKVSNHRVHLLILVTLKFIDTNFLPHDTSN